MNGHDQLTSSITTGLAIFYFLCALLNVGFALYQFYARRNMVQTLVWGAVAVLFLVHAVLYVANGRNLVIPHAARDLTDWLMGPVTYTTVSVVGFILLLYF